MTRFTSNLDSILMDNNFETLSIVRAGRDCYLVINAGGKSQVYSDNRGKKKVYRHAWQLKDWLKKAFGIESDAIQVNEIKYDRPAIQVKATSKKN
jgi:hypothetical protein